MTPIDNLENGNNKIERTFEDQLNDLQKTLQLEAHHFQNLKKICLEESLPIDSEEEFLLGIKLLNSSNKLTNLLSQHLPAQDFYSAVLEASNIQNEKDESTVDVTNNVSNTVENLKIDLISTYNLLLDSQLSHKLLKKYGTEESLKNICSNIDKLFLSMVDGILPSFDSNVKKVLSIGGLYFLLDWLGDQPSEDQNKFFASISSIDLTKDSGKNLFEKLYNIASSNPEFSKKTNNLHRFYGLLQNNLSVLGDGKSVEIFNDPIKMISFLKSNENQISLLDLSKKESMVVLGFHDLLPKSGSVFGLNDESISQLREISAKLPDNDGMVNAIDLMSSLDLKKNDIAVGSSIEKNQIFGYINGVKSILQYVELWDDVKPMLDALLWFFGVQGGIAQLEKESLASELSLTKENHATLQRINKLYFDGRNTHLIDSDIALAKTITSNLGYDQNFELVLQQLDFTKLQEIFQDDEFFSMLSPEVLTVIKDSLPSGVDISQPVKFKKEIIDTFLGHPLLYKQIFDSFNAEKINLNPQSFVHSMLSIWSRGSKGNLGFIKGAITFPTRTLSLRSLESSSPSLDSTDSTTNLSSTSEKPPLSYETTQLDETKKISDLTLDETKIMFLRIFGDGPGTQILFAKAQGSKEMILRTLMLGYVEGTFNFGIKNVDPNNFSGQQNIGTFQISEQKSFNDPTHKYHRLVEQGKQICKQHNIAVDSQLNDPQKDLLSWIAHIYFDRSHQNDSVFEKLRDPNLSDSDLKTLMSTTIQGGVSAIGESIVNQKNNNKVSDYKNFFRFNVEMKNSFSQKKIGERGKDIMLYGDSIVEGWKSQLPHEKYGPDLIEYHRGKSTAFFLENLQHKSLNGQKPFDGKTKNLLFFSTANDSNVENFSFNMKKIIELCKSKGVTPILSTHYYEGENPVGMRNRKVNPLIRTFAKEYQLPLIDFRDDNFFVEGLSEVADHPNGNQYNQMVAVMKKYIESQQPTV